MGARVTPQALPCPAIPPPCTEGKRFVKPYGKYVENADAGVSEQRFLQARTLDGSTIQRMRLSSRPGCSTIRLPCKSCLNASIFNNKKPEQKVRAEVFLSAWQK